MDKSLEISNDNERPRDIGKLHVLKPNESIDLTGLLQEKAGPDAEQLWAFDELASKANAKPADLPEGNDRISA